MAQALAFRAGFEKTRPSFNFFDWVSRVCTQIGENNPRLKRVRALQALSDQQLHKLGLERDEIVHEVFRDVYYR